MPDYSGDDTGTGPAFSTLFNSALQFATPFAQRLIGTTSTPSQLQSERLRDAALNGSGPNDSTLAGQSPQGLLDFITGRTGTQNTTQSGGGSFLSSSSNLTFIGVIAVAIIAVIVVLKR
jgi:hypothetical protein